MAFCTKCGKKLGDGVKFCTNCGTPVGAAAAFQKTGEKTVDTAAARKTGEKTGKAQKPSSQLRIRSYNVGRADYRKLNNVSLVSKPSQHKTFNIITLLIEPIILIYILIVLFPVLREAEGSAEIEYVPGMFPGLSATILVSIICGIMIHSIRLDIFNKLPKGFDYWKIKGLLRRQVFGLESIKVALKRFFRKEDCDYPELGVGTDDEGNYYAFAVAGNDVKEYPYHDKKDNP